MVIEQAQFIPYDIDIFRIILAIGMLVIATFQDLKKREVHDILWIGFGAIAAILIFLEFDNLSFIINTLISIAIVVPFAFFFWRMGFFGGADAFALMVLSGLAPLITLSGGQITPITTLTNAVILSLIMLIVNVFSNLRSIIDHEKIFEGFDESSSRKAIAFFMGTWSKNPRYSFSLQKTDGQTKKFDFSLKHAENAEFCTKQNTWVTPGVPFLIYITAGFLVQIFFGDILFSLWQPIFGI